MTTEDNNKIHYPDLTFQRNNNNIELSIYRKPTDTDTTIHFQSNHPHENKIATVRYYINRMYTLPITEKARKEVWNTIVTMAINYGYPKNIIYNLRKKLTDRKNCNETQEQRKDQSKKWTTSTYFSPMIRRITNLFKDTNIIIAFRKTNTIQQQLSKEKENINRINPNGMYKLQCNTCNRVYIGQTGISINIRYKDHIRYIKYNNPQSVYAAHILQNRHEYGPQQETLQLLKHCHKGTRMTSWENLYIQTHYIHGTLITEQQVNETNPLYNAANITRIIPNSTRSDTVNQGEEKLQHPNPSQTRNGKKLYCAIQYANYLDLYQ